MIRFRLSPAQTRVFVLLMASEVVPRETLRDVALNGCSDSNVGVQIWKMRQKLKRFQIEIECVRDQGYFIAPETKARVKALLQEGEQ